jgi:hypothetical protein
VADEIRAIEYCQSVSTCAEREALNEKYKDEPWKIIEHDEGVQGMLLLFLPVVNKDPKRYRFFADHPPLVVIQCLDLADYQKLSDYDEKEGSTESTWGFASRESLLVPDIPPEFEAFKGRIAVIRNEADLFVRIHEQEHLLYGRYIADAKMKDLREIDELGAYCAENAYRFDEAAIFSDIRKNPVEPLRAKYRPDWQRVKHQLLRFTYHGVQPAELIAKIEASDDLDDLATRLARVKLPGATFHKEYSLEFYGWCLEEGIKFENFFGSRAAEKFSEYKIRASIKEIVDFVAVSAPLKALDGRLAEDIFDGIVKYAHQLKRQGLSFEQASDYYLADDFRTFVSALNTIRKRLQDAHPVLAENIWDMSPRLMVEPETRGLAGIMISTCEQFSEVLHIVGQIDETILGIRIYSPTINEHNLAEVIKTEFKFDGFERISFAEKLTWTKKLLAVAKKAKWKYHEQYLKLDSVEWQLVEAGHLLEEATYRKQSRPEMNIFEFLRLVQKTLRQRRRELAQIKGKQKTA